MSSARNSCTEIHTSASENESDRHSTKDSKQRTVPIRNKSGSNQGLDELQAASNQKKKLSHLSASTSYLYSEGIDEVSSSDGVTIRNTSSASSEKDFSISRSPDARCSHLTPPCVLLNTSTNSATSVNSTSSKEESYEKPDNQSFIDGASESSLYPDNLSRSSESGKSVDLGLQRSSDIHASKTDISKAEKGRGGEKKEKKKSSWYNVLNPTYKSRSEDFKRLFKDLPDSERLIVDYSCALQKDILIQGRLYISQNYICFYANIFRWETSVLIRCRDVTSMTKEKTARVIPNAIQITTDSEKHFFTSFGARDKTFLMLFRIWQNALLEQPISSQELWQWVHFSYGEELGLTSDDDDYVAPLLQDEDAKCTKMSDLKYLDKSFEKAESSALQESASELLPDEENSESASGMNGSCDQPIIQEVIEETTPKSADESKSVSSQKPPGFPTDMSDTTESGDNIEEVEFKCPCTSHEGKELLNTVFPFSVDQMFSLLFTGSKFYYDLLSSRKTYDVMESPWQICPDFDCKMRQVTYTVTLNHAMAKSAQTTETQRLLKHSKASQVYTVDCDVVNTGIPYCDTFTVKSVYCITRVSKKECRLRLSGCVHYKKSVWGLVKSIIEKSAMQGLADFATDLEASLNKEAENSSQQSLGKKTRRRKRMKFDPKCENLKDAPRSLQRQATIRNIGPSLSSLDLGALGTTPDVVVRVILVTLVVLLFLNVLLFYKLWSLEDQSVKQVTPSVWEYQESQSTLTKEDIMHLLQKQDALHRAETERWRDALSEVIKLIHLIEKSLSELKSSIDSYSGASLFKAVALRMSQNSEEAASTETTTKASEVVEEIQN